jgi:hypothetical protein
MEISLGQFYKLDSLPVSAQEVVNLYCNIPEMDTVSKKQLFIPAGIKPATTAGTDVYNRGGHNFLGVPYLVQGERLYRIDRTIDGFGVASYSSVLVSATAIPGNERVIMADNGQEGGQMMIVCPELNTKFNAFIYASGSLVAVSDGDFDGPVSDVNYIDGYFEFTKKDGQKFFISDLRDGSSYISTDFEAAEADPDYNIRSFVLKNRLYVLGKQTIQGFQNVGGEGFPFVYIQGSVQSIGLASIYSATQDDDILYFVGGGENEKPSIYVFDGSQVQKISTTAIDQELSRYSEETIRLSFTWNYSQSGGVFIGFTFPGERCFVFDVKSKEWHTRVSLNSMGEEVPYRVSTVIDVYGILMVGDRYTNKVGILSKDVFTEYEEEIPRYFVTPQVDNQGMPFFINSLEVVSNVGSAPLDIIPQVGLQVSKDGGRTFNYELMRAAGLTGQYNKRTIWGQLGRVAREVCFRLNLYGAIPWAITKVEVNFE